MLAARWWEQGDVRVEEVPHPGEPPDGWVRLRVDACGICGTDVEEYTAGPNIVPTTPHPVTGSSAPLTLGHEAVGTVESVGRGVSLEPGTRVAAEANIFCGECWWCRRHQYQLCEELASIGLMADGGLAEMMLAPEYMCIPFDGSTSSEDAAMAEPLSVAVRAARRADLRLGETVGVVGAGTIGLLSVQVARVMGARTIVAVERLEERRQLAVELGADVAVAPEDAHEAGLDLTGGVGLDAVIEAAGNPQAVSEAVKLARRGGRAVVLGVFDGAVPVDMMDLLMGEKEIIASLSHVYDTDFATAVNLIERGQIDTAPLITDLIALDDVVEQGFKALVTEPEKHLKIIVQPNGHQR